MRRAWYTSCSAHPLRMPGGPALFQNCSSVAPHANGFARARAKKQTMCVCVCVCATSGLRRSIHGVVCMEELACTFTCACELGALAETRGGSVGVGTGAQKRRVRTARPSPPGVGHADLPMEPLSPRSARSTVGGRPRHSRSACRAIDRHPAEARCVEILGHRHARCHDVRLGFAAQVLSRQAVQKHLVGFGAARPRSRASAAVCAWHDVVVVVGCSQTPLRAQSQVPAR